MANEYADLAELKEMRKIPVEDTAEDARIQRALTRASRAIDSRCGRRFYADDEVSLRTFHGIGRVVWKTDAAVYALLVDDISTAVGLTLADYSDTIATWPENAIARGRAIEAISVGAYGGARNFDVTAKWGWPAIPDPIVEATLLLANRRFMRADSPEGITGWSQEGAVRVSRFDPDIEDLVDPFVIPGFGS